MVVVVQGGGFSSAADSSLRALTDMICLVQLNATMCAGERVTATLAMHQTSATNFTTAHTHTYTEAGSACRQSS